MKDTWFSEFLLPAPIVDFTTVLARGAI